MIQAQQHYQMQCEQREQMRAAAEKHRQAMAKHALE
eukprot:SAG11_NODE_41081_length_198_cov_31.404040_1_plen_35_part_10